MGVDSGLPDFRGNEGFWRAYPPFAALGLRFEELANPRWFQEDVGLAWGFYGHRLDLYRRTKPHAGFEVLKRWASTKPTEAFVFTSNVDGQFEAAGFPGDQLVECHGSIHHLQCCASCSQETWLADGIMIEVDPDSMRASGSLPQCPHCFGPARPNILMFGDRQWISRRTSDQLARYTAWLEQLRGARLALIECGAGTALPQVRSESEWIAHRADASLIRINPREANVPAGPHVGIMSGALEALVAIDRAS